MWHYLLPKVPLNSYSGYGIYLGTLGHPIPAFTASSTVFTWFTFPAMIAVQASAYRHDFPKLVYHVCIGFKIGPLS